MESKISNHTTIPAIAAGVLTSFISNIQIHDLVKTALLSAIGTVVSYIVSIAMRQLFKKLHKKSEHDNEK